MILDEFSKNEQLSSWYCSFANTYSAYRINGVPSIRNYYSSGLVVSS